MHLSFPVSSSVFSVCGPPTADGGGSRAGDSDCYLDLDEAIRHNRIGGGGFPTVRGQHKSGHHSQAQRSRALLLHRRRDGGYSDDNDDDYDDDDNVVGNSPVTPTDRVARFLAYRDLWESDNFLYHRATYKSDLAAYHRRLKRDYDSNFTPDPFDAATGASVTAASAKEWIRRRREFLNKKNSKEQQMKENICKDGVFGPPPALPPRAVSGPDAVGGTAASGRRGNGPSARSGRQQQQPMDGRLATTPRGAKLEGMAAAGRQEGT
eukprot:GHVU01135302.1.p1 GENE.GHVU01135302.1~~GHVU01135302.1.p1  ORF type:complete len:265 (+),score=56.68 GHVU01135302.1:803-1597(+)